MHRPLNYEEGAKVVDLYRRGLNFSEVAKVLGVDRHRIGPTLVLYKEPRRQPAPSKKVWTHRYEKTPKGFLMRAYRNMQSRVTGVQWKKAHLYKGLPILDRAAFYAWSHDNPHFWRLYYAWTASGFQRGLTPSVNRIDPKQGYLLPNMEWLTHSVNSGLSRPRLAIQRCYAILSA